MTGLTGCLVIWGQTGAKSLPSFYLWCPVDISLKFMHILSILKFMHILSIDQCSQNQEIRRIPANSGKIRRNLAKSGEFRRNPADSGEIRLPYVAGMCQPRVWGGTFNRHLVQLSLRVKEWRYRKSD